MWSVLAGVWSVLAGVTVLYNPMYFSMQALASLLAHMLARIVTEIADLAVEAALRVDRD